MTSSLSDSGMFRAGMFQINGATLSYFLVCLCRALKLGYLTQDMIDDYEPALMFTIPRLAIVW